MARTIISVIAGYFAMFVLAFAGFKAYMPAFWSLPSLFLTEAAAAGSIGLINSIGNLGGFLGPSVLGRVESLTGSFVGGIYFLSFSMACSAITVFFLGLGAKEPQRHTPEAVTTAAQR